MPNQNVRKVHGWYSPHMDSRWGTDRWKTVDGKEVHTTCITYSPDDNGGTKWTDIVCVGEVVEFLGKGHPSSEPELFEDLPEDGWLDLDEEITEPLMKINCPPVTGIN